MSIGFISPRQKKPPDVKSDQLVTSGGFLLPVSVHLFVVVLIFSAYDLFPPLTVIKIPADRLLYTVRKFRFEKPSKLVVDLCGIDGIAHVISFESVRRRLPDPPLSRIMFIG